MTETLRDQVWNAALEELVARGKFRAADLLDLLDLSEKQHQAVRRTLSALEEDSWLVRDSSQSRIWRLGRKGKMLLNVSEDTIDESRR